MPASAPARMARLDIQTACDRRPRPTGRPEAWLMRVEANGHGVITDDRLNSVRCAPTNFLLMGLRSPEGIAQAVRGARRPHARSAPHRGLARRRRDRGRSRRPAARHGQAGFPCSMRWWPISRRKIRYAPKLWRHGNRHAAPRRHAHDRQARVHWRRRAESEQSVDTGGIRRDWSSRRVNSAALLALSPAPRPAQRIIGQRRGSHAAPSRTSYGSGRRRRGSRLGSGAA